MPAANTHRPQARSRSFSNRPSAPSIKGPAGVYLGHLQGASLEGQARDGGAWMPQSPCTPTTLFPHRLKPPRPLTAALAGRLVEQA